MESETDCPEPNHISMRKLWHGWILTTYETNVLGVMTGHNEIGGVGWFSGDLEGSGNEKRFFRLHAIVFFSAP